MNWLDVLCQPPVLTSLVPHLNGADARSLFSCARRLHQSLKGSAELRVIVWGKPHPDASKWRIEWCPTEMLKDIAKHGDVDAMRHICSILRSTHDKEDYSALDIYSFWFPVPTDLRARKRLYYWDPLRRALNVALDHQKYEISDFLTDNGFAQVTMETMIDAIANADLRLVQYLDRRYSQITAFVHTVLYRDGAIIGHWEPTHAATAMDIIGHVLVVKTLHRPTEQHIAIHKWLTRMTHHDGPRRSKSPYISS